MFDEGTHGKGYPNTDFAVIEEKGLKGNRVDQKRNRFGKMLSEKILKQSNVGISPPADAASKTIAVK
jgi:hypothetical protein